MLKIALLAFGLRFASSREPTIAELMADSMVKATMLADGVDPVALEAELRCKAREISNRRRRIASFSAHIES